MAGEGAGMGRLRPLDTPLTDLLAPRGVMAGPVRYWPQAKFKTRAAVPVLGNILAGGKMHPTDVGAQAGAQNRNPEVVWG